MQEKIPMNKISVYFIVCVLAMPIYAFSQKIHGKIVDNKNMPLPFANIIILSSVDSTFIGGVASNDEGRFVLDQLKKGDILKVSSIGYETRYQQYIGEDSLIIQLPVSSFLLEDVVVKAHLPKTILRGESMKTIVAGSILEKTSSINHLLSSIPQISVQNGKIEIFGKGSPDIYVNGRKVINTIELELIKPQEVKDIEVITNPGARYGASTTSVIHITTKKKLGEGISFDTKTDFRINEQGKPSCIENLDFNYRKGNFDIHAYLYGAYTRQQDDKSLKQMTYLDKVWEQTNDIKQEFIKLNPFAEMSMNYILNPHNSIGVSFSYDQYVKNIAKGSAKSSLSYGMLKLEESDLYYDMPQTSNDLLSNIYYVGKIGKVGIDFNADYYRNKRQEDMHSTERYKERNNDQLTNIIDTKRTIYNTLFAGKLILSMPLIKGSFSIGGEYSSSKRKSTYSVLPHDVVSNDNHRIRENMIAVFTEYNKNFGIVSIQAGLRYEYVDFNYYNNDIYIEKQSKKYNNLFPSVAISFPVGNTQMQLTYASDVSRPSYHALRDGVQYDNRYTYESGNPFLLPSISQNISYAFSWDWINLSSSYAQVSNKICNIMQTYNADPKATLTRPENMPTYHKMQTTLSLKPVWGIWHPALETTLYKQWFKMDTNNSKTNLNHPIALFNLTNTFDTKWATASLILRAQTEGNMENTFIRKGFWGVDLSLYKSWEQGKYSLQLYIRDLLGTADMHRVFYSDSEKVAYYDAYSSSMISLTFRYHFNTTKSKYKGTGAGVSQRDRM